MGELNIYMAKEYQYKTKEFQYLSKNKYLVISIIQFIIASLFFLLAISLLIPIRFIQELAMLSLLAIILLPFNFPFYWMYLIINIIISIVNERISPIGLISHTLHYFSEEVNYYYLII